MPTNVPISGKFVPEGGGSYELMDAVRVQYDDTTSGLAATDVQDAIDELSTLLAQGSPDQTGLVSGGGVAWSSGYTFVVSAATYYIAGTLYSSAQQSVTLAAADPTNPRYDVIYVDDTGTVGAITGTPSATPIVPQVDPGTQLALTTVSVPAGSSGATITVTLVYDEDAGTGGGEWTATSSGTGWALADTTDPYHGSKDISATSVAAGAYVQFAAGSGSDWSTADEVVFYILNKAGWANKKSILIQFYSAGTPVGKAVSLLNGAYGFNASNTTNYQQVVIPISAFGLSSGGSENQLRFTMSGSGTNIGFYLDYVQIQSGISTLNLPVPVSEGGTGDTSMAPYAVLCGGTGSTSPLQQVSGLGSSGQVLTSNGASALPTWQPAGGSGTVTSVGLSMPPEFSIPGTNPITTSGTLAVTKAAQSANLVYAGPSSGAAAAPTFRALVGGDLPNPSASTLGGIQSAAAVSHQWIDSISTSGIPHLSQPAFSDISGTISTSQLPTSGLEVDQHYGAIGSVTASAGAAAVNLATNDWWTVNLSHSATTTLSLTSPTVGQQFTLILIQDGTGSNLVSWFSTIKWPGGTVPTLSTGAGAIDVFTFKCYGGGTYYGFTPGLAMA